ncbi:threonine/serine dehydratase [Cytophagales bacterium LB-30]|uniref:Threonine/serine dehydratase n=1 Tax=Shiella aurantiaca TaxID=3058365 RepID=A0ABT8F925_9BACT|nr:threonine/serine dehydratase [Shiella aurantiaca]MDN4166749.1 threonine/serine dehydratase [Shiella aurantiaca]
MIKVSLPDIQAAAQRIAPLIHHTPVLHSESIDAIAGCTVYFKCENFQKIGAFKMRGASNAILSLSAEERAQGVATHSSGNHAQAVARAAKVLGIPAYIVMPETAPKVKIEAVKGYGAEVILCPPKLKDREAYLAEVVSRTGAQVIHPYDDERIIAGQGTAALELLEEQPDLQIILTPVGGGGLLSGTAIAAKSLKPGIQVIAGEPLGADDAYRSFHSGKKEINTSTNTLADGLLTNLGDRNLEIILQYVDDIIRVSDEEIVQAMRLIWERMKIIIEPSCAVPFAAVLQQKERVAGKKIGIILSGGNVDLAKLPFR